MVDVLPRPLFTSAIYVSLFPLNTSLSLRAYVGLYRLVWLSHTLTMFAPTSCKFIIEKPLVVWLTFI